MIPAMDWEGKVANANFTCAATGRPLAPGEVCWSALRQDGQEFRRLDFAAEAWLEQDRGPLISWWRQTVPQPEKGRAQVRLDPALLRQLFTDLRDSHDRARQCLCFVIALCLVRAREFGLAGVNEDQGVAWMLLDDKKERTRLRVRDPRMTAEEQAKVQETLLTILGVSGGDQPTATGPTVAEPKVAEPPRRKYVRKNAAQPGESP